MSIWAYILPGRLADAESTTIAIWRAGYYEPAADLTDHVFVTALRPLIR